MKAFRRVMWILLVALLLKGAFWALTLPALDGPDEGTHFHYAQVLAVRGRLPVSNRVNEYADNVLLLGHQTLIDEYPGSSPAPRARFYVERSGTGPTRPSEAAVARALANPGLNSGLAEYGPVTYGPYALAIKLAGDNIIDQLFASRMVAVVFGALGALAAVWAAREAGLDQRLSLAVGAVVGFQPMWSQQSAIVTADAGVLLFSTLTLALLLRWWRDRRGWTALAATASLCLGLFSKPAMLFAVPLLLVLLIPAMQPGVAVQQRLRRGTVFVGCVLGALAPYGAWAMMRHGVIAQRPVQFSIGSYAQFATAGVFQPYRSMLASYWGNFGWQEGRLPEAVAVPLVVAGAAMLALAVIALIRPSRVPRPVIAGLLLFVLANFLSVVVLDVAIWRLDGTSILDARYVLPGLPAIVIAAAAGAHSLLGRHRAWIVAPALLLMALSVNMISLDTIWGRLFIS